eukprot:4736832-Lingulodinium_polyedra.AAC.1
MEVEVVVASAREDMEPKGKPPPFPNLRAFGCNHALVGWNGACCEQQPWPSRLPRGSVWQR